MKVLIIIGIILIVSALLAAALTKLSRVTNKRFEKAWAEFERTYWTEEDDRNC